MRSSLFFLSTLLIPSAYATSEDGLDLVDDDGDGDIRIRRVWSEDFSAALQSTGCPPGIWTCASNGDAVKLGLNGSEWRVGPFPWATGDIHVYLAATLVSGNISSCSIKKYQPMVGTNSQPLHQGVGHYVFPFFSLIETQISIAVSCAGNVELQLDWMALQNGAYEFAPARDQSWNYTTTGMQGGGGMIAIRKSADGSMIFAGSDVGGFAWTSVGWPPSEEGWDFQTANGDGDDLIDGLGMGVNDIASQDGSEIFILTTYDSLLDIEVGYSTMGEEIRPYTGLYVSHDLGEHWTGIEYNDGTGVQAIGASKYYDDGYYATYEVDDPTVPNGSGVGEEKPYRTDTGKWFSSGKLLLQHVDGSGTVWTYVGSNLDDRNIYTLRSSMTSGYDIFKPYQDNSLPKDLPLLAERVRANGKTYMAATEEYDGQVSALEIGRTTEGTEFLIVGYRILPDIDDPVDERDDYSLWVCPLCETAGDTVCDGSEQYACVAIEDDDLTISMRLDVRDIVVDPVRDGMIYVVDGGRRFEADAFVDTALGYTSAPLNQRLVRKESTVLGLRVFEPEGATGPEEWEFSLWDTDTMEEDNHPDWLLTPEGYFVENLNGRCEAVAYSPTSGYVTYGNLVGAPHEGMGDVHEISENVYAVWGGAPNSSTLTGAEISPDGNYLFTWYPMNGGNGAYGCASLFRTNLNILDQEWEPVFDWHPFQGMNEDIDIDIQQRRLNSDTRESNLKDLYIKEMLPTFLLRDAVFVDEAITMGGADLLLGGSTLWWALQGNPMTGVQGWNSTGDLDLAQFVQAYDSDLTFQDLTMFDVDACHNCISLNGPLALTDQVDRAFGLSGDGIMVAAHGSGAWERSSPMLDCHIYSLGGEGRSLDVWEDPDGILDAQVWLATSTGVGSDGADASGYRTLSYSDDNGDTFCWDAVYPDHPARRNHIVEGGYGHLDLTCAGDDSQTDTWTSCSPDANHMQQDVVGSIWDLQAIGDQKALAVAVKGELEIFDGDVHNVDGTGLFLVDRGQTALGNGLHYYKIGNAPIGEATDPYTSDPYTLTCAEEDDFFQGSAYMKVIVQEGVDISLPFLAWLHSPGCGLYAVWVDPEPEVDGFDVDNNPDESTWHHVVYENACDTRTNASPGYAQDIAIDRSGRYLYFSSGSSSGEFAPHTFCIVDLNEVIPTEMIAQLGFWEQEEIEIPEEAVFRTDVLGTEFEPMYLVGSAILPHPHIDSETYFVGQVGNGCDQCNDPGVYVMERRYDYVSGEWEYISSLTSAETLESAGVNGLDWGSSGMSGHMGKLYAGGMGIWEGGVTW